ncbi:hypothetical protein [Pseudoalteromonas sp. T1lg24]|nr:hypothetical protein [Pseudoalteromonas sp. T1lg24]
MFFSNFSNLKDAFWQNNYKEIIMKTVDKFSYMPGTGGTGGGTDDENKK